MIGVDPNAQGRGLGGARMRHAVASCGQEGALAYLESSNPRNISLYERHGFEMIERSGFRRPYSGIPRSSLNH